MTLPEIKKLATELMTEHGLIKKGWALRFDNSKRRNGLCHQGQKYISLSRVLMPLKRDEAVKNTILHEIAHALVGCEHGHNHVWRKKAIEIGCNGERCSNNSSYIDKDEAKATIVAQSKYTMACPKCGNISAAHRRPKRSRACGHCCRKHNGGKYSDEFKLILTQNY